MNNFAACNGWKQNSDRLSGWMGESFVGHGGREGVLDCLRR